MNVYGELKKAILELIASPTTTPAVTGRIYCDTTAPTAAVPRFYNGTSWLALLTGQSTALVSQNSGTSCTVNWANGLNQQVILTANCVINFSNPQSGQIHTLVVTSAPYLPAASGGATASYFGYAFNMTDQDSRRQPYQPLQPLANQGSNVHAWFYAANIKPLYATIPSAQFPPKNPAAAVFWMDISFDGKYLLYTSTSSPFTFGQQIFDSPSLSLSTVGYVDIGASATAAAATNGVKFTPDGRAIFVASGTTPFLQGWWMDRGKPTGTAFANPVTLPAGFAACVNVHPNGAFVGVGHTTTPFMSIYPFTGQAYGTKLTNPVALPAAAVNMFAWSPQGDYLAAFSSATPFLQVWTFNTNLSTIGGVAANPSILPAGAPSVSAGIKSLAWRPQGDYIALAMNTTPFLYVVPFNRTTGAFGTPLTIAAQPGLCDCVAWTPDGQFLLVGCQSAPFFLVYNFSAGTVGTSIAFDGSNPGQSVQAIEVHPNGEYAYLGMGTTTFLTSYTLPSVARNYLRLVD